MVLLTWIFWTWPHLNKLSADTLQDLTSFTGSLSEIDLVTQYLRGMLFVNN